jgi:hypothetical protein
VINNYHNPEWPKVKVKYHEEKVTKTDRISWSLFKAEKNKWGCIVALINKGGGDNSKISFLNSYV